MGRVSSEPKWIFSINTDLSSSYQLLGAECPGPVVGAPGAGSALRRRGEYLLPRQPPPRRARVGRRLRPLPGTPGTVVPFPLCRWSQRLQSHLWGRPIWGTLCWDGVPGSGRRGAGVVVVPNQPSPRPPPVVEVLGSAVSGRSGGSGSHSCAQPLPALQVRVHH